MSDCRKNTCTAHVCVPLAAAMISTPDQVCMLAVPAEDVISCVQAVLELSSMIAPKLYLELRLKGFALAVCHSIWA